MTARYIVRWCVCDSGIKIEAHALTLSLIIWKGELLILASSLHPLRGAREKEHTESEGIKIIIHGLLFTGALSLSLSLGLVWIYIWESSFPSRALFLSRSVINETLAAANGACV